MENEQPKNSGGLPMRAIRQGRGEEKRAKEKKKSHERELGRKNEAHQQPKFLIGSAMLKRSGRKAVPT